MNHIPALASEAHSTTERTGHFVLNTGWALVLIACFWGVTRLYPLKVVEPRVSIEVGETRKLLDYGFVQRGGAILEPTYATGKIANPEQFNYVDHPLPIFWVFALIYRFAGPWGMEGLSVVINFLSCWLLFRVLKSYFDLKPALLATLAYTLAAPSIYYSFDPNVVFLGTILWIAALLVIAAGKRRGQITHQHARLLGLCVFLAGQIDWYALSIVPALLAITADRKPTLKESLRDSWKSSLWRWIVTGYVLSLSVFLLQIILGRPNLAEPAGKLWARMGLTASWITGPNMAKMLLVKIVLALVGPALFLGFCLSLWMCFRRRECPPLVLGASVYFLTFLSGIGVLWYYYFMESHVYAYLLVPLSCASAYWLQHTKMRSSAVLFAVLIIPGIVVGTAHSANRTQASETSRALVPYFTEYSRPEDLNLTNLRARQYPFPVTDHNSVGATAVMADRIIRSGVTTVAEMQADVHELSPRHFRVLYWLDPQIPIDPDLSQLLATKGKLTETLQVPLPQEHESIGERLRILYWKFTKRENVANNAPTRDHLTTLPLQLYEVHL